MPKDELFKALADPTRRGILRFLGKGEMTAGEIAAKFQISAPSMSHHFTVLKGADLIFARRAGQHQSASRRRQRPKHGEGVQGQ